ncbi:hypothetical protein LN042_35370 [Kitasatospora sp. RB6PN24]|uniref:hypothetical protein n=1 Tax=Kitasatospora humi TaxID=2893891 RepID=UPI001E608042|nr:hypothetical protein [Kitasatospora humi]MCC9312284.1 hypothetical protein [Kitasatospora humi]
MTAAPIDWMNPPGRRWTYEQVKDLDLPFDFELVDGEIGPRGMTGYWHNTRSLRRGRHPLLLARRTR